MSSFIQWPTIYGSAYFLPGIIVVLLVLGLLLLVLSHRRAATERAGLAPASLAEAAVLEPPALAEMAPEAVHTPAAAPGIVTQPATMLLQPASPAQPVVAATQPALARPLTLVPPPSVLEPNVLEPAAEETAVETTVSQTVVAETAGSGRRSRANRGSGGEARVVPIATNDPVQATIQDILNGWGDLSAEDMKRLELFRPERLSAALENARLPKSSPAEARMRMNQLRLYADTLEQRASAAAQTVAAAAAVATPEAPSAALVASAPLADPEPLPIRQTASIFSGYAAPAVPDAQAEPAADPRPLWEPDPGMPFEELAAPAYQEVEMDTLAKHDLLFGGAAALQVSAAALPMSAPAAAPETPASPMIETQPAARSLYDDADDFFWDDQPLKTVSRLAIKVETAEQLLALPTSERVDLVAFLPPAELVATFRASHDLELKKAVIDTLEHIGSPASLNALGNCFEDCDGDVQQYALAAADRLLGVA